MKRYQLRFDDAMTAALAAASLRRSGLQVRRSHFYLLVTASSYQDVDRALKLWMMRRGRVTKWLLIDTN